MREAGISTTSGSRISCFSGVGMRETKEIAGYGIAFFFHGFIN